MTPRNANAPGQGRVSGNCESSLQTSLSYPAAGSVKANVLADLLVWPAITGMDVWEKHGSSRASHHILMLRKAGWPIITTEIDAPTSDGRRARIASYSLPAETIAAAGERGQEYARECARIEAERKRA